MNDETKKKKWQSDITWTAAEFEHAEKDALWYLTIGGLAVIFIILSIWQKNYFFILFLIIAFGYLMWSARERPRVLEFSLTEEGLQIETRTFRYEQLQSFSVRSRPGHLDELVFRKHVAVNPFLHVPIDSTLARKAAAALREVLPEGEYEESLLDTLFDWLKV